MNTHAVVKDAIVHTQNQENAWEESSVRQGEWVERLNHAEHIHFKSDKTDISFSV